MTLYCIKTFLLTIAIGNAAFASELRGSTVQERELETCSNNVAYGQVDRGCNTNSPICVSADGREISADISGDHCARCLHVFATPLAIAYYQDFGCPVNQPHCLKDGAYPALWFEGNECSATPTISTPCSNDRVGALKDTGCNTAKPFCANADSTEPVFLKSGTKCLDCYSKYYTPLAARLEALSDQELYNRATGGNRIGYWCYIEEFPPGGVCKHYAKGRPNQLDGYDGVPRTMPGDGGTGCVNEVGGFNWCSNPNVSYLTAAELADMCTTGPDHLVNNAAAQIRWALRHGMCYRFCEALNYCMEDTERVEGNIVGEVRYVNGGENLPAGDYVAMFDRGCMKYRGDYKWAVSEGSGMGQWYLVGQDTSSTIAELPGTKNGGSYNGFDTYEQCQTANRQLVVEFHHNGGKVGVWLRDNIYVDNEATGRYPPTWSIGRKINCP